MVRSILILCLFFAAVSAGCAGDAVVPGVVKSASFSIERVAVHPAEAQLGDEVRVVVSVRNVGDAEGIPRVAIPLGDARLSALAMAVEPGATHDATATARPTRGGSLEVVATVDGSRGTTYVTVRAPRLSDAQWDHEDLWCTDRVPFSVTVHNGGDGVARDAVLKATIYNENNVAQDEKTAALGTIEPGRSGSASVSLFARDTCGRDDYYFVKFSITPRFGQDVSATTSRFSI